jgi:hypothetical protein
VFCHSCHNEWYRDEHGLQCPDSDCGSDIVEVVGLYSLCPWTSRRRDPALLPELKAGVLTVSQIEPDNDPREIEEDPPRAESPPHSPLHNHNPWGDEAPDPDEGNIDHVEWNGPGIHFTRTIYRSHGPGGTPRGVDPHPFGPFGTPLASASSGPTATAASNPADPARSTAGPTSPFHPVARDGSPNSNERSMPPAGIALFGPALGGNGLRATVYPSYPSGQTRDQANAAIDDLTGIINTIFQNMHAVPMDANGPRTPFPAIPINPIALFSHLINPANARAGDAVYTQEALDRVISQLMDTHAPSTAPGPASAAAIAALPPKAIGTEDLDVAGKAECSICMDGVEIGATVTQLPCKHWFHAECVGEWLRAHDTCPQCRRSITPQDGDGSVPRTTGQTPRNMAWLLGGGGTEQPATGTQNNPPIIPNSPERPRGERRSGMERRTGSYEGPADGSAGRGGGGILGWAGRRFGGGGSGSGSGSRSGNAGPRDANGS